MKNFLNKNGYLMPIIYAYKTLINNPTFFFYDVYNDIRKDIIWKKKYSVGHNIICFSLPKSGSTLVEQIFRNFGYIDIFNTCIRRFKRLPITAHPNEIHSGYFELLPKNKSNFMKVHSHFDIKYPELLEKNNFLPFILIRDIRDMMISRYYHIINDPNHSEHHEIKNQSFDEGFLSSLLTIKSGDKFSQLQYFNNWIVDWVKFNKYPIIKYEELNLNKENFLNKIQNFTMHDSTDKKIQNEKKIFSLKTDNLSIKKKLSFHGKKKDTFRKGRSGDWKQKLNNDHKSIFKKIAQEALEIAGYEKDTNW